LHHDVVAFMTLLVVSKCTRIKSVRSKFFLGGERDDTDAAVQ
jgi:hypothetical protein